MKVELSPLTIDALTVLSQSAELSRGQLGDLSDFLEVNKKSIHGALLEGLADEQRGSQVAISLLKLQSVRMALVNDSAHKYLNSKKPVDEARMLIAIAGQVFLILGDWMRTNKVDRITTDTLPSLEEFVTLEILRTNRVREMINVESD